MDSKHIWQVDVAGNIYETDFAGMTQWIAESSLLPEDKVRRADMPWVQAKLLPALEPYFAGAPPLVSQNVVNSGGNYNASENVTHFSTTGDQETETNSGTNFGVTPPVTSTGYAPYSAEPAEQVQVLDFSDLAETTHVEIADVMEVPPAMLETFSPVEYPQESYAHFEIAPVEYVMETQPAAPIESAPYSIPEGPIDFSQVSIQEPAPVVASEPVTETLYQPEPEPAPVVGVVSAAEPIGLVSNSSDAGGAAGTVGAAASGKSCIFHSAREVAYTCRQCLSFFCSECPRDMAKVKICPKCGDMCTPYGEDLGVRPTFKRKTSAGAGRSNSGGDVYVDPNFSFQDFLSAWSYPFKFPLALLVGGVLNGAFAVAVSMGAATVMIGGVFPGLMTMLFFTVASAMIVYGCATKAVNQVAYGRSDESFMIDTEDFSIWDTILKPCFLGIATLAISWGPAVIVAIMIFKAFSGVALEMQKNAAIAEREQIEQVEQKAKFLSPEEIEELDAAEFEAIVSRSSATNATQRVQDIAKNSPTMSLVEDGEEQPKSQDEIFAETFAKSAGKIVPLILALLVAGVWGLFYFPTALAVAGYTGSIGSTLNPLAGFGMMREMGGNYLKAFGTYLLLLVVGFLLLIVVSVVASPFAAMGLGQLPAQVLINMLSFYLCIVIGCIFGLALYRSHDKMGFSVAK